MVSGISKPKPTTLFIGLMGMTGVGKSSFIKKLTGDPEIIIGRGLKSCTQEIQPARMNYVDEETKKEYDIYLIDTPGYDDTNRTDTETLKTFVKWLELKEVANVKLSGLIYLHRITDDRIGGSAAKNLTMMQNLVGEDNLKNVMLVTSRWEGMTSEDDLYVAEEREKELKNQGGYWHAMLNFGASYHRYDNKVETAKEIIKQLVHNSPAFLQIQKELKEGLSLGDTAAGKALIEKYEKDRLEQEKKLKAQQVELDALKKEMADAKNMGSKLDALKAMYEASIQEQKDTMKRMEDAAAQKEELARADKEKLEERVTELQRELSKKPPNFCSVM